MNDEIRLSGKRLLISSILISATAIYIGLISAQFLAAEFSRASTGAGLRWAIKLDPANAEYRDELAQAELRVAAQPADALYWSRTATLRNPNNSRYWVHRAMAEQALWDLSAEQNSLRRATGSERLSAQLAWDIANLYLAQGDSESALREYSEVMKSDPPLMPKAIETCWRIHPDADFLLQNVIPPNAEKAFLSFFVSNNEGEAAKKVWNKIVSLQQPVERPALFDYLRYLFAKHEAVQAAGVWQQSASLSNLTAYQPTVDNLVINGDFSLEVLNGGFDWQYQKTPTVSLALDPIESHSGSKSLRISFEGPGIADAGIRQIVSVEPGTRYDFSAYYRAEEMDGAGGPRFEIQDLYGENTFFMSDDLRNSEFWTPVEGTFTTAAGTQGIVLRIARVPEGSPIRGKLWIDDLKLVTADHLAALKKEKP